MILRGPMNDGPAACSRARCVEDAAWKVNWRNPRIHGPERVKVWLACDEHRDFLAQYLAERSFPVHVTPVTETIDRLPEPEPEAEPGAEAEVEPAADAETGAEPDADVAAKGGAQ